MKSKYFKYFIALAIFWIFLIILQIETIKDFQIEEGTFSGIIIPYHNKHYNFLIERDGRVNELLRISKGYRSIKKLSILDKNYTIGDKIELMGAKLPYNKYNRFYLPKIYVLDINLKEENKTFFNSSEINISEIEKFECGKSIGTGKLVKIKGNLTDYKLNQSMNDYKLINFHVLRLDKKSLKIYVPVKYINLKTIERSNLELTGIFKGNCTFLCFNINKALSI